MMTVGATEPIFGVSDGSLADVTSSAVPWTSRGASQSRASIGVVNVLRTAFADDSDRRREHLHCGPLHQALRRSRNLNRGRIGSFGRW